MAHFQERRSGGDRRQFRGEDRRRKLDRRSNSNHDIEFIEHARFKAWLAMTDKSIED